MLWMAVTVCHVSCNVRVTRCSFFTSSWYYYFTCVRFTRKVNFHCFLLPWHHQVSHSCDERKKKRHLAFNQLFATFSTQPVEWIYIKCQWNRHFTPSLSLFSQSKTNYEWKRRLPRYLDDRFSKVRDTLTLADALISSMRQSEGESERERIKNLLWIGSCVLSVWRGKRKSPLDQLKIQWVHSDFSPSPHLSKHSWH